MLAKTQAVSLIGLAGGLVDVEVDISSALPSFVLVGLPDASLSEACSRVRSACVNSGFDFPARRITVNLSPAALPKYGSGFDLAIALGILAASGQIQKSILRGFVFIGELGLDGSLRTVNGTLAALLQAKQHGFTKVGLPASSAAEAKLIDGIEFFSAMDLASLVTKLQLGVGEFAGADASEDFREVSDLDLADVIGQPEAVFALQVAAAGRHNLSMVGSPGAGKTMLAERLPTLLPDLSTEQAIEAAAIHSLVGSTALTEQGRLRTRPVFIAPHHSASSSAIIGGGMGLPKPGAISLAHGGVLFLDEITEFQNHTLQSLREPLEARRITIARSAGQAVFPANFQLVVAANPCPCGHYGSRKVACECSVLSRQRYLTKLGGPLFDRIDIRLQIQPVGSLLSRMEDSEAATMTADARSRVLAARLQARERLAGTRFESNAEVTSAFLRTKLKLARNATQQLNKAVDRGLLSMRGYDRCLRLAWTIADLEGKTSPTADEVVRAMALRSAELLA